MMKQKPTISAHLLSVARPNSAVVVANLLPLITSVLKKKRFISKTRELLDCEPESEAPVRVLYEQVMEMVFTLSGDLRHDKTRSYYRLLLTKKKKKATKTVTVDLICQQCLDSLLGLPPIPDFIRIIQRLLMHTKIEVEISGLRLTKTQG